MKAITIPVGPMPENAYICYDEGTKEAVVVDPGDEAARITQAIEQHGLKLKAIILTHGHYDHIMAVPALKAKFDIPVVAHAAEAAVLERADYNFSALTAGALSFTPDIFVADGETFAVGEGALRVIHTPGHTPGGVCYYDEDAGLLFSGDTLFCECIGRTDFPYGDTAALFHAVEDKLFTLPDHVAVLPGHESASTIAHERTHNADMNALRGQY